MVRRSVGITVALILFFCCLIDFSQADLFPTPPITEDEEAVYFIKPKNEAERASIKWGVNPYENYLYLHNTVEVTPAGKRLIMQSSLKDQKFLGELKMEQTFLAQAKGLKQIRFRKIMTNLKTGKETFSYDLQFNNIPTPLPPDIYTAEVFPLVLRGLNFAAAPSGDFFWWASERSIIPMHYMVVKDRRQVKVPYGTFYAYEVSVVVDFNRYMRVGSLLLKLIKPFIPVYNYFFAVEQPHYLILYKGPFGPPGSPEMAMELTAIKKK